MPAYNTQHFNPPAPVALVTLRKLESALKVTNIPMLIDSGADVTLVPKTAVQQLDLSLASEAQHQLIGFDGQSSLSSVVHLQMNLAGRNFTGKFLIIDQEWGVLGRNILNHLKILLDGQNSSWEIHSVK